MNQLISTVATTINPVGNDGDDLQGKVIGILIQFDATDGGIGSTSSEHGTVLQFIRVSGRWLIFYDAFAALLLGLVFLSDFLGLRLRQGILSPEAGAYAAEDCGKDHNQTQNDAHGSLDQSMASVAFCFSTHFVFLSL